ncbi:MAG: hypothetical protein WC979_02420 [Candidatus Pacearchaeota archaeon]|jgi:hypothetical protein|nr:hypothetical protein [Clostridia bacterium]
MIKDFKELINSEVPNEQENQEEKFKTFDAFITTDEEAETAPAPKVEESTITSITNGKGIIEWLERKLEKDETVILSITKNANNIYTWSDVTGE